MFKKKKKKIELHVDACKSEWLKKNLKVTS